MSEPRSGLGRLGDQLSRMRSTSLGVDTRWSLILQGSRVVVSLMTFTLLGRALGADGYGQFAALYAVIAPLSSMSSSGVSLALLDHVMRDREDLNRTFRSCFSMTLAFGLPLLAVGTTVASLIVDISVTTILSIFAVELLAFPIYTTATQAVYTRDGFARAARYRVMYQVVRGGAVLGLFLADSLSIASFGALTLGLTAALALFVLHTVKREYSVTPRPGPIVRRHVRTSGVYAAGITGLSLQTDGDKLLLASYGQTLATGLYSAAYRVVMLGLVPIDALVGATHHRFLDDDGEGRDVFIWRSVLLSLAALAYGAVFAVAVIVAAPLLPKIVGSDFDESVEIVRWLSPLVAIRGLAMFPLNGLMGLGKTALRTVLLLASSVLSIGIYIALIPTYSWKGAAIGTMAGEVALAAAAWYLLVKHHRYQPLHGLRSPLRERWRPNEPGRYTFEPELFQPTPVPPRWRRSAHRGRHAVGSGVSRDRPER